MDFQITKKNWLEFNTVDVEEEDDDDEEEIKPGFFEKKTFMHSSVIMELIIRLDVDEDEMIYRKGISKEKTFPNSKEHLLSKKKQVRKFFLE